MGLPLVGINALNLLRSFFVKEASPVLVAESDLDFVVDVGPAADVSAVERSRLTRNPTFRLNELF